VKPGARSFGEREITCRISLVAVCCSSASTSSRSRARSCPSASVRARCWSLCEAAGEPLGLVLSNGVPHSRQNLACEGFSCWHRGHCMPPSGVRAGKGQNSGSRLDCRRLGGQMPEVSSAAPSGADPVQHPQASPAARTPPHTDTPGEQGNRFRRARWRRRSGAVSVIVADEIFKVSQ
jgi:hypothetical protein